MITVCTLVSIFVGGSIHNKQCHYTDETRLLMIKMQPLKDSFLKIQFHFFSLLFFNFSNMFSQFLLTEDSSPRYTPRYLKPVLFHDSPPGKTSFLLNPSPTVSASLFPPVHFVDESKQKLLTFLTRTSISSCVLTRPIASSASRQTT